jgi:prepilin-type N-terminal cleavage/methylation domain-containing protein
MNNKSFTLIEILVVIVVIGVLSAFILVGMSSITSSANIAKGKAFINSMDNALLLGRVSQWKLDQTSGTAPGPYTVSDSWSSNTGTLYDGASTACVFGGSSTVCPQPVTSGCPSDNCLSFDGINDYASVNDNDSLDFGAGSMTLSFWITAPFVKNVQGGGLFAKKVFASVGWDFRTTQTSTFLYEEYYGGLSCGTVGSSSSLPSGWNHVVFVKNVVGKRLYIYYNAVVNNSSSYNTAYNTDNNNNLLLSSNMSGWLNWEGYKLDDVRIYNQAIPTSEIQQNYFLGINNLYKNGGITQIEYTQRLTELKTNLTQD